MSWDVTFHFRQELRSEFFNTLLRGIMQPGVYNPNICVYTGEGGNSDAAIRVKILAGTTLIFSNAFEIYNDGASRYQRSLTTFENSEYIVKAVVQSDIDQAVIVADGTNDSFFEQTTGPTPVPNAPVIFIYAFFDYDPANPGSITPSIRFAVPDSNGIITDPATRIINEDEEVSSAELNQSYLLLGTLIDTNQYFLPSTSSSYISGSVWITQSVNGRDGQQRWTDNHVFTARGLPDYNRQLSLNSLQDPVSMIFSNEYSRAYLTSGAFSYGGVFHRVSGPSWKDVYDQGNGIPPSSAPAGASTAGFTGIMFDREYATNAATTYTASTVTPLPQNKLIIEVYFYSLESQETTPTIQDLTGLFTSATYEVVRRILPYRLEVDITPAIRTALDTRTSMIGSNDFNLPGVSIVPLDASLINIERLKDLIANRNIIPPIIDRLRKDEELSPFLTADKSDVLIPLAIAFKSTEDTPTPADYEQEGTSRTMFNSAAESAVNPANILTFLELQASSFSVFGITNLSEDVFSSLTFLDDSETQ